tara:strand:- start:985 stop:1413 length:429 start_codon:yes stop_codon:yes gene_type:complete
MIRKRIDIKIDYNKYISPIGRDAMEMKIITRMISCINNISKEGEKINEVEVGTKVGDTLEFHPGFFRQTLHAYKLTRDLITKGKIGTINNIDVILNRNINESAYMEYHFIINYGDDDKKQYVYINRNIQKEREKVINEILDE